MTDDVITLALHIAYSDSYSEICDIIGKIHSQQLRALAYISGIHTISKYNNNKRAIARKLIDRVALPIDDIIENRAPSAINEQDNFIVRLFKEAHARVSFAPEIPPEPEINPNPQHGDILYSSAFTYHVKKKAICVNYSVKLIKRDCNTNSEKWAGAITLLFIDENGQNLAAFAPYSSLVQVNSNHELLRKNPVRQFCFIQQALKDITEKRTKILQSINFLDDHGNRIPDGLEAFRYCYYRDNMYCKATNAYFREMFRMPEKPFSDGNYPGNPLTWPESPERSFGLILAHAFMFYRIEMIHTNNNTKAARNAFMPFLKVLRIQLHQTWLQLLNRLEREQAASLEQSDNTNHEVPETMPEISRDTYADMPLASDTTSNEPDTIDAETLNFSPQTAQPDSKNAPVIDHTPAPFFSSTSPLIHSAAWRRTLFWLFAILWVFCLRNLNRNKAQNFHRPLGNHELRLTETRGLKGRELHEAIASNIQATLHSDSQDSLAKGLANLSASAVKKIGRQLGLLTPKEKGSGGTLGGVLADRLFAHRTNPQDCSKPKTYTDCKRQIVIIFD